LRLCAQAATLIGMKSWFQLPVALMRTLLVGVLTGLLAFACLREFMPPPSATLLSRHAQAQEVAQFLDALGTHKPILAAYGDLLASYARGELGTSWVNQLPVYEQLKPALINSLLLTMPGTLLAHGFALFCAAWAKPNQAGWNYFAQFSTACGLLLWALIAQWFFAGPWVFAFDSFSAFGLQTQTFTGYLRTIAAPSAALLLAIFGAQFSYYRVLMQARERRRMQMGARALGFRGLRLFNLGLRPAMYAVLARLGSSIPMQVLGGSVVVEMVFAVPGIGRAGVNAAMANDAPILCAIAIFAALALALCTGAAEILARWLDPRLSHREARLS
jgi:ABC-type dipeptide/oligopeptide/nickel transport system permease component